MKVKFIPQNVEFEIKPGQSVMHVAQDHDIYVKSVCKGVPSCAECRVRIVDGEHNVLPPGSEELSLIGTGHFIDRRRLSCQLKCFGDITVDMTEQIAKQQGLIGGQKKKKLAIKDDRVEDATTIRTSTSFDDETAEVNEAESVETDATAPHHQPHERDQQPRREQQQPRREQRPQQQQQQRPPNRSQNQQRAESGASQPSPQRQAERAPHPQGGNNPNREGGSGSGGGRRKRRRGGRGGGGSGGEGAPRGP